MGIEKMTEQRKKPINLLKDGNKFLLWQALVSIKAELEAERPTYELVAQQMTRQLGFLVTACNIRTAVEQGIISWKPLRTPGRSGKPRARSLHALERRIAHLEQYISQLAEHLGLPAIDWGQDRVQEIATPEEG